jgi:transposase
MLKLPARVRVFLATVPCDMRRQLDGLSALVRSGMERDPRNGDLYVFRNKRGDMLKALFVDAHGLSMLVKRLDRGRFRVVFDDARQRKGAIEVSAAELAHLLTQLTLECRRSPLDA